MGSKAALKVLLVDVVEKDIELITTLTKRDVSKQIDLNTVTSINKAEQALIDNVYDVVLFGLPLNQAAHIEFLKNLKSIYQIPVVLLLALGERAHKSLGDTEFLYKHSLNTVLLHKSLAHVSEKSLLLQRIKKIEKNLKALSTLDNLTGLSNRNSFCQQLKEHINTSQRSGLKFATLFIGVDGFKSINDRYGHEVGDQVLKQIATRFGKCLRKVDKLARISGDEFALLAPNVATPNAAAKIAQNLQQAVSSVFEIDGYALKLTISVGISICPDDAASLESVFYNADHAMKRAKKSGGDKFQYFSREMNESVKQRIMVENHFQQALDNGEFVLHYQPLLNATGQSIVCAEALVRWQHPQKGLLPPESFIPVMEQSNIISQLGEWVLYEACRQNKIWQDAGLPKIRVAVNISTRQLCNTDMVAVVEKALNLSGLKPQWLELEVTENVLMQDMERAFRIISELKEMGVRISIDDFGTGFSSLNYLKKLPIDKVKVDKSFVQDLSIGDRDSAIVKAIIAMAKSLTIETVAEGIETRDQHNFLESMGCDYLQGYLFHKPVQSSCFGNLLGSQSSVFGEALVAGA